MERASPFRDLAWRAVGPRMQGGRIEAIAVAPGRTSTIYAGAGGVQKSINGNMGAVRQRIHRVDCAPWLRP
jgi:hypothetical protein